MRRAWLFVLLLSLGCGKTELPRPPDAVAADPHDVPITEADIKLPANYAEALPRIKEYRDSIRQHIEAGTPDHAHRALDELDIVLNKLPSIAKTSGVPIDHWEAINIASRDLRNAFNQLHSAIDEKRKPDYTAVADPIDKAIARLEQVP